MNHGPGRMRSMHGRCGPGSQDSRVKAANRSRRSGTFRAYCARANSRHTLRTKPAWSPHSKQVAKLALGQEVDPDNEPLTHWSFAKNDEVKLPVYYHWSFSTGMRISSSSLRNSFRPLSDEEKQVALSGIAGDMDLRDPGNGMGELNNLESDRCLSQARCIMPDPPPSGTVIPLRVLKLRN